MLELPPLADLRRRRSAKWRLCGQDVLPLWVAERDVGLAPAVRDVLAQAVSDGGAWLDLGRPAADLLRTGVAVSDGADFGSPGWVRLNFGTSAEILTEAFSRLDT